MSRIKVTITAGQPDHILLDGEHLPGASFTYVDGDDGIRRVIVRQVDGAGWSSRGFPVAYGTFEGDTHPRDNDDRSDDK